MHRYIIKRLLLMIPVIIGVSFLVFFIMDLAPGDAVDILARERQRRIWKRSVMIWVWISRSLYGM